MKWTITIDDTQNCAVVVTSGTADSEGSLNMGKAIGSFMRKHMCTKLLIDHSNIESVTGEIIEIYNRPEELKETGIIPGIMVAEVVKPEHKEFFSFLETVCVNRGFLFSTFNNRNAALDWLQTL